MTEIGITYARTEDIDPSPGLERGDGTGVAPEIGRRRLAGSGATPEKEEGGDIETKSEMGAETREIEIGAGVGRSTGRGEVGALINPQP